MNNQILSATLRYLQSAANDRHVTNVHLTRFFTTVSLDDGSLGACMSYYTSPDDVLKDLENRLQTFCSDPFEVLNTDRLHETMANKTTERQREYIIASLMAAVASALSYQIICCGGDEWFEVRTVREDRWLEGAESALVVGFGGYLESFISERRLRRVHVLDLGYDQTERGYQKQLSAWKRDHPDRVITGSRVLQSALALRSFDVISISGSTLGNGSLEYFLAGARSDAIIILQGQSASIHPKLLFESGVNWVATTLKPPHLHAIESSGHAGCWMCSVLQGGLPWIYLTPRNRPNDL